MQPESIAQAVQERANPHLRACISAADTAHIPATTLFADDVGQYEAQKRVDVLLSMLQVHPGLH